RLVSLNYPRGSRPKWRGIGALRENPAGRGAQCAARVCATAQSIGRLGPALFGLLPVLQRLRAQLNPLQIGIDAVRPRRIVRLLRGRLLAPGLLLRPAFLALAFALALLL